MNELLQKCSIFVISCKKKKKNNIGTNISRDSRWDNALSFTIETLKERNDEGT